MKQTGRMKVAIVDYGMGNLFSVKHAFSNVGVEAIITSSPRQLMEADAVVLPGVGAFGSAMDTLHRMDMVRPLQDVASSGKYLVGICLGQQLLLTESCEFGNHKGLGLIEGQVVPFEQPIDHTGRSLKVPQVGWNRIHSPVSASLSNSTDQGEMEFSKGWRESALNGLPDGTSMYFVHSYYAKPEDPRAVLSVSRYGDVTFCSSIQKDNVLSFQFHPERSGPRGLRVYRTLADMIGNGEQHKRPDPNVIPNFQS